MKEFVTPAIVLRAAPAGGNDRTADLFTLTLGRLEARMVGARALVSKFAPHADPLNLVTVRLVKKNRYTLADVFTRDRFLALRRAPRALGRALAALAALRALMPKEAPDPRLFHETLRGLSRASLAPADVLAALGYDPRAARCVRCGKSPVHGFAPVDEVFFCDACSKGIRDRVVLGLY